MHSIPTGQALLSSLSKHRRRRRSLRAERTRGLEGRHTRPPPTPCGSRAERVRTEGPPDAQGRRLRQPTQSLHSGVPRPPRKY